MADLELPWECYTLPGSVAKKRKAPKDQSGIAVKKEGRIHKKKKKSKLREAIKGTKEKKKKRKKHKAMKSAVDSDLTSTPANSKRLKTGETSAKKSAGAQPHRACEPPLLDGSPSIRTHRKVKTKKKVAFESDSGSSVAKHPMAVFPSTQLNVKEVSSSQQSQGPVGCLVKGALGKQCKTEPEDNNESQSTSDDINSQDLFITQKKFRAPSIDQSSGEVTVEGIAAVRRYGERQEMVVCRHKEPKRQQEHHREMYEELTKPTDKASTKSQTLEMVLEEDVCLKPIPCRRIRLPLKLKQEAKTIQHAHETPIRNPYLENPKPLSSSIDVKKLPDFLVSNQASLEPRPTLPLSTANTSTQTENFFTTELCCYLKFQQQSRLDRMEVMALDLSLPQRMRADPGMSSLDSVKTTSGLKVQGSVGVMGGTDTSPSLCPAFRPGKHRDFRVPPPSSSVQPKVESTPSPQSEVEPKSSDTTASSEDNEASGRSGRADLLQVKAVQMRLNESFFFKTKGEGSPRPESPLMKLIQGRETRSKKKC
ncbi:hypothetical protein NHX12_003353 [Muraenolepis orangiensis]|uniref:Uncharacterized protein n=1 Tax=Muraenolepis orangiensis TaxID=630683 RepID=A0A9Q0IGE2_9TELE|nr:hypothetical protein NHX12_003353 [Muraenolepis orangiensis]